MITLRRGLLLLHLPTTPTTVPSSRLQPTALDVRHFASAPTRQSKILRKLVAGKEKTKRHWYADSPTAPKLVSAAALSNPQRQGKNASRRVHVLNKLFMKHITDLLSTGEQADLIVGRGLLVSHVKVSADFNYVNVFWSTTAPPSTSQSTADVASKSAAAAEADTELETLLRSVAGLLRHELSQLRLMGEVPRINFVRDRQLASDAHIDALLARADFGPDYEPAGWAQLNQDLTASGAGDDRTARDALPIMRHDVLGLNQSEIMGKIRSKMAKSRQAWDRYTAEQTLPRNDVDAIVGADYPASVGDSEVPMSLAERRTQLAEETRQRDEEFAKFLEQRRFSRKLRTVQKNPDFREAYDRPSYDDDEEEEAADWQRWSGGGDYIEEDVSAR